MSAPDLTALVEARVRAEVTALRGRVQGAADLAALIERDVLPQRRPYAFVVDLGEDATPPGPGTMIFRQRVTSLVGVVLIEDKAGDVKGAAARAALTPLVTAVRDALVGWTAPGVDWPVEYRRARLLAMRGGLVFRQVDVAGSWLLTAP